MSVHEESRTHYYTVQVPREVMNKKLMQKEVDVELPFEVFLTRAKKIVLSDLRDSMLRKPLSN